MTTSQTAGGTLRAFLVIQALIGYEWLSSGLTKIVHGNFPAGLAAQLRGDGGASGWYRDFLDTAAVPNARPLGYVIESTELLVGAVLIATAFLLLAHRVSLASGAGRALRVAAGAASAVCVLLALNFLLASGMGIGPIAHDSFDEGISVDALLVGVQLVIAAWGLAAIPLRESSRTWAPGEARNQARVLAR